MPKSTVVRVSRNPNNKQGCIVSLENGTTLWLQTSYITSVLESNFIDDTRPTAVIGSEVEYQVANVKAGDLVLDKNGKVAAGTTAKYTKERPVQHSIRFNAVEGHITDYDKQRMLSSAVAKAMTQTASLFAAKPAAKQLEAEPAADAGTGAEDISKKDAAVPAKKAKKAVAVADDAEDEDAEDSI